MIDIIRSQPNPLKLAKMLWPNVVFYKEQREAIMSVWENDETFMPAANKMGKDFVSAYIVLLFFLTRTPCRIITSSAKDDHLTVLWGEMKRAIQTSRFPLDAKEGGPLVVNHREIRKIVNGKEEPISYIKGMVASQDSIASMQGHHAQGKIPGIPYTLAVIDESSSARDDYYTMMKTWCHRFLSLGNTWQCNNFFYRAVEGDPANDDPGGDRYSQDGSRCYRKVLRIPAKRSPNVRLALAEIAKGKKPSHRILVPGVLTYDEYVTRRETWDKIRQCVSLDALFYKGAELLLFPPDWLNAAEDYALSLPSRRNGTAMGVDPAEGGDSTSWCIIDRDGVIDLRTEKTPDTTVVVSKTLALMQEYGVPPEKVCFDRGGGGKQHVDRLRAEGYNVQSVAFGETVKSENRFDRRIKAKEERVEEEEQRYVYKNRRAEMYGRASLMLDPMADQRFGIPSRFVDLRLQLAPLPKLYDEEGRLMLPPKRKRDDRDTRQTIMDMIGRSPDEADSFVLALHAEFAQPSVITLTAL